MSTPDQPPFDDRGYPLTPDAVRHAKAAPPTVPGELPAAPKRWPTVIGIIAIVVGGLGMLINGFSIVSSAFMGSFMGMAASGSGGGQTDAFMAEMMKMMARYRPMLIAAGAASVLTAMLLLTAGIGVAGRRRWSVSTIRVWAVVRMVVVIGASVVTFMMQRDQFTIMQNMQTAQTSPGAPPAAVTAVMSSAVPLVSLVFTLLWGWALPIFMLIWFAVPKVKAETVRWP